MNQDQEKNKSGKWTSSRRIIGYWMNEKKIRKFIQPEFLALCRNHGIEPVEINLNRPLEEQGPFTIILHKLTDVIARANLGDPEAQTILQSFERYLRENPDVIMIDPLEKIQHLLDRTRTYNLISNSQLGKEDILFTPPFVELTTSDKTENRNKLAEACVKFPIICKPTVAHGSQLAHQMALIFNEDCLGDISIPCVAQSFINHGAILYKLYVVGEKWYLVPRPSLKNFYAGDYKTIYFNSHVVSKADSDCCLNKLDPDDKDRPLREPSQEKLEKIISTVRETLQMGLFGVDVVIDIETGRYAIVDINAFPGYDGVDTFFRDLIEYMLNQMQQRHSNSNEQTCPSSSSCTSMVRSFSFKMDTHQADDSGIEMNDSSDEKKSQKFKSKNLTKYSSSSSSK